MALGSIFSTRRRQCDQRAAAKAGRDFDIMVKGGAAFWDGKSQCWCPYALDTHEWKAWMVGWGQAYDRSDYNR